jgi:hypothetical protein
MYLDDGDSDDDGGNPFPDFESMFPREMLRKAGFWDGMRSEWYRKGLGEHPGPAGAAQRPYGGHVYWKKDRQGGQVGGGAAAGPVQPQYRRYEDGQAGRSRPMAGMMRIRMRTGTGIVTATARVRTRRMLRTGMGMGMSMGMATGRGKAAAVVLVLVQ